MKLKILALSSVLLLLSTTTVACTNGSKSGNNGSQVSESIVKKDSTGKLPTSTNKKIAKQVEKEMNKDGKVGKVTVDTEVIDDQSAKDKEGNGVYHQIVHALLTDKKLISKLDSESDDTDMLKEGIKEIADDYSSKLKGHDTLTIDYEIDDSQYNTVALNNKEGRIIR